MHVGDAHRAVATAEGAVLQHEGRDAMLGQHAGHLGATVLVAQRYEASARHDYHRRSVPRARGWTERFEGRLAHVIDQHLTVFRGVPRLRHPQRHGSPRRVKREEGAAGIRVRGCGRRA